MKHWAFYRSLVSGERTPKTQGQEHFVEVACGYKDPETEHEKAYMKYLCLQAEFEEQKTRILESGKSKSSKGHPEPSSRHNHSAKTHHPLNKDQIKSFLSRVKRKLNRELLEIEGRDDLSEDQKSSHIINRFAIVCAAVAIQPLPFADILILTPIQIFMAERLASIRGVPLGLAKPKETLIEIGKVVGLGLLAQQAAIGAYKTILPGLGGFMSIPLVFGLTYAIGRVLDFNYQQLRKGNKVDPEELRKIFREARKEGKAEGKRRAAEVKEAQL